jgi:hypothetical protein
MKNKIFVVIILLLVGSLILNLTFMFKNNTQKYPHSDLKCAENEVLSNLFDVLVEELKVTNYSVNKFINKVCTGELNDKYIDNNLLFMSNQSEVLLIPDYEHFSLLQRKRRVYKVNFYGEGVFMFSSFELDANLSLEKELLKIHNKSTEYCRQ